VLESLHGDRVTSPHGSGVRFEEWYDASRLCDAALNMVEVHRESNPAMSQRYQNDR